VGDLNHDGNPYTGTLVGPGSGANRYPGRAHFVPVADDAEDDHGTHDRSDALEPDDSQ